MAMSLKKGSISWKMLAILVVVSVALSSIMIDMLSVKSSEASINALPSPTSLLPVSKVYSLPLLRGLKLDEANPLNIDFIIDTADTGDVTREEASMLIRYFLAALTLPENDLWVNLSPYEKDRIAPESLSVTEMGRDMLAQDYVLKQLISTLTYPENNTGKDFWDKTYEKVLSVAGTLNIPINTFNKVWIIPGDAFVYENNGLAVIKDASLKVMLEEDYMAQEKNVADINKGKESKISEDKITEINKASSSVMREVVIPEIEDDVNYGKNFARLRQIYHSLVLGKWFKQKFQNSFYRHYMNKGKVDGIDNAELADRQKIFNTYVKAFEKGCYDYVKKHFDPGTKKNIKRRYFSGGADMKNIDVSSAMVSKTEISEVLSSALLNSKGEATRVNVNLQNLVRSGEGIENGKGIKFPVKLEKTAYKLFEDVFNGGSLAKNEKETFLHILEDLQALANDKKARFSDDVIGLFDNVVNTYQKDFPWHNVDHAVHHINNGYAPLKKMLQDKGLDDAVVADILMQYTNAALVHDTGYGEGLEVQLKSKETAVLKKSNVRHEDRSIDLFLNKSSKMHAIDVVLGTLMIAATKMSPILNIDTKLAEMKEMLTLGDLASDSFFDYLESEVFDQFALENRQALTDALNKVKSNLGKLDTQTLYAGILASQSFAYLDPRDSSVASVDRIEDLYMNEFKPELEEILGLAGTPEIAKRIYASTGSEITELLMPVIQQLSLKISDENLFEEIKARLSMLAGLLDGSASKASKYKKTLGFYEYFLDKFVRQDVAENFEEFNGKYEAVKEEIRAKIIETSSALSTETIAKIGAAIGTPIIGLGIMMIMGLSANKTTEAVNGYFGVENAPIVVEQQEKVEKVFQAATNLEMELNKEKGNSSSALGVVGKTALTLSVIAATMLMPSSASAETNSEKRMNEIKSFSMSIEQTGNDMYSIRRDLAGLRSRVNRSVNQEVKAEFLKAEAKAKAKLQILKKAKINEQLEKADALASEMKASLDNDNGSLTSINIDAARKIFRQSFKNGAIDQASFEKRLIGLADLQILLASKNKSPSAMDFLNAAKIYKEVIAITANPTAVAKMAVSKLDGLKIVLGSRFTAGIERQQEVILNEASAVAGSAIESWEKAVDTQKKKLRTMLAAGLIVLTSLSCSVNMSKDVSNNVANSKFITAIKKAVNAHVNLKQNVESALLQNPAIGSSAITDEFNKGGIDLQGLKVDALAGSSPIAFAPFDVSDFVGFTFEITKLERYDTPDAMLASFL